MPRPGCKSDVVATCEIAGAVIAIVVCAAIVVHLTCAQPARHALGLTFPGVPAQPQIALQIFTHNVKLAGGAMLAATTQAYFRCHPAELDARGTSFPRRPLYLLDVILTGAVIANAAIVGAAIGAGGWRTVLATLPQAPVELAGFAIALNLYRRCRRRPVSLRASLTAAATSMTILAVSAVLETYVSFHR
jgi:hypothetical protein